MTDTSDKPVVHFVAVGDLLFNADFEGEPQPQPGADRFAGVREILSAGDVVFGNLECTLPDENDENARPDASDLPSWPRVVGRPEQVRSIQSAGFTVVTMANNHTFDHLQGGFHRVRGMLDEMGIVHFGAGDNFEQAVAPAIVESKGVRLGFLGGATHRCLAGPDTHGIASVDGERLCEQIAELRRQVHHVIVTLHWGEEKYAIPSPEQVQLARRLVDSGASLVLGHHAHVVQGMEVYRGAGVFYSFGNFVSCEVDGTPRWKRVNRTGFILQADITAESISNFRQIPTYDDGCVISVDGSAFGKRRIRRTNRAIARGVTLRRYRWEAFLVTFVKAAIWYLRWERLKKLRWRNVKNAFKAVAKSAKAN